MAAGNSYLRSDSESLGHFAPFSVSATTSAPVSPPLLQLTNKVVHDHQEALGLFTPGLTRRRRDCFFLFLLLFFFDNGEALSLSQCCGN